MSNYNSDFYRWTKEQAALLRAGRLSDLDLENLIEEIETMGRSEKRELSSRLSVLLVHLLKWHYQSFRRGTSWELTIKNQRLDLAEILQDNPSLKALLPELLDAAYQKARNTAAKETKITLSVFPSTCPWVLEQLLDQAYFPN